MSFLFKNYSLVKVMYLLTRLFLLNANNTDRNGVNERNTHTHTHTQTHTYTHKHSEKDNTRKG